MRGESPVVAAASELIRGDLLDEKRSYGKVSIEGS